MKLKLVGAERYISPMTDHNLVEKGNVVEVTDANAEEMLQENWKDALNNEHPLWVEATDEDMKPKAAARVARTKGGKKSEDSDTEE